MLKGPWIGLMLLIVTLSGCSIAPPKEHAVIVKQEGPIYRTALRTMPSDYGTRMILSSDFLFSSLSNRLKEGYEPTLRQVYQTIVDANPYQKIIISAHTHTQANRFDMAHLTQLQADRIASYLWASGIPKNKTAVLGMADRHPVSSNASTTGQADNRRVEIHIIK